MSVKNIYIDDSNLAIGGKTLHNRQATMPCAFWNYKISVLYANIMEQFHANEYETGHLHFYGADLDRNPQLGFLRANGLAYGYDCPRNGRGREKEADVVLAIDMIGHATMWSDIGMPCDIALVSGDGDFFPAVARALFFGSNVHVWSWRGSISQKFVRLETSLNDYPLHGVGQFSIHYLDPHLQQLTS
ncbi:hypothetical protein FPOA_03773 [Fusarium poae]|uniref:NYN domain-containing protein n=1 Tax=Fusarium poae TaxID=36050 RepID=A0A1B8ARV8_FUSPO|nr:hypothetical protein FPOA_03773 [Fusarium poae]